MASHKLSENPYKRYGPLFKKHVVLNQNNRVTLINHFPNAGVEVRILKSMNGGVTTNRDRILADYLPPSKSFMVKGVQLTEGSRIRVYLKKYINSRKVLISDYVLEATRAVNEIHIGQVTTRFVGATWDDQIVTSNQGMRWIKIHNMLKIPLHLNYNIVVPPLSSYTYRGRHHFGVPMGMIFKDRDNIYSTVTITKPITDIYYGLVSDLPQELWGGWAWGDYDFTPGDFQYLFQDGIESGTPDPNINFNQDSYPKNFDLRSYN